MFKFDHFIFNINASYQINQNVISEIKEVGFLYEPTWGKGTRGFKASNIWIGQEYFELIQLLKNDGGGWKTDWVDRYLKGERGLICLMLDVENIEELYQDLIKQDVMITHPEFLRFKWFLNLFTRTMPWRNCYLDFFEGIPLQIGFQQMKDKKSREFMNQYMIPNCRDVGVTGIQTIIIHGKLTKQDHCLIQTVFRNYIELVSPLTICLDSGQKIIFKESESYHIEMMTTCRNEDLLGKTLKIENVIVHHVS